MKYRYHWMFKLMALVLAIVSGAVLVLGAAGMVLGPGGYYADRRQGQLYQNVEHYCYRAAGAAIDRFAWKDTGIEPMLFERFFRWDADVDAVEKLEYDFYYIIRDSGGNVVESNCPADLEGDWVTYHTLGVRRGYVTEMPKAPYYPTFYEFTGLHGESDAVYADLQGMPLPALGEDVTDTEYYVVSDDESVNWQNISTQSYLHADANGSDYTIYRMEYTRYETYAVEVRMTDAQMAGLVDVPLETEFLAVVLEEHGDLFGPMAIWGGICLVLSILCLAMLAGGSPNREEIKPGGLNLIPLDLYLMAAGIGIVCLMALAFECADSMIWNSGWGNYDRTGGMELFCLEAGALALCGGAGGGIIALFFMACAAQMKMGDGYWLKHTAVGLCWRYGWKYGKMAVLWCWSTAKKTVRGFWGFARRFWSLLPLCWQWLLAYGGLWVLMVFSLVFGLFRYHPLLLLFGIAVTVLAVLYGAYCFGCLRDAAKKMSGGNLSEKLENKYLLGCFGEFAEHLNVLGDVCVESARQQMKSERMKSELITNVSHDIKTPLTSIINYVDLLQKTEDDQARKEYLEVLDRQSQQLKKLIEDLMEMSRASSGNLSVEITPTDLTEAVNQALGEFADKLDARDLKVMRKMPSEPLMARCDGRHLWRVLSNVLGNVVKYAMPGTRVYVDVLDRGSQAEISVKNISAEMLNISAGELMERFVRGDASRNTEGNGLGLNIARSLMELQNGRLDLVVDGDLFKVVLTLPAAASEKTGL